MRPTVWLSAVFTLKEEVFGFSRAFEVDAVGQRSDRAGPPIGCFTLLFLLQEPMGALDHFVIQSVDKPSGNKFLFSYTLFPDRVDKLAGNKLLSTHTLFTQPADFTGKEAI